MSVPTCEICGDVVKAPTKAKCGHMVDLCKVCLKECPGASEKCVECDVGGAKELLAQLRGER